MTHDKDPIRELIQRITNLGPWNRENHKLLQAAHDRGLNIPDAAIKSHYLLGLSNLQTIIAGGRDLSRLGDPEVTAITRQAVNLGWKTVFGALLWENAAICTPEVIVTHVAKIYSIANADGDFPRSQWTMAAAMVRKTM